MKRIFRRNHHTKAGSAQYEQVRLSPIAWIDTYYKQLDPLLKQIGPFLTLPGLLCHALIFWLLFFPYTYFQKGMCHVNCLFSTTGWQAWGAILALPLLPYLLFLLSLRWKGMQQKGWLEVLLKLNALLDMGGFLVIYVMLQYPFVELQMDDTTDDLAWHDKDYVLHLSLLLFAAFLSGIISVLLGSWLRRGRKDIKRLATYDPHYL